MKTQRCRLYLITPPKIELGTFSETLKRALGAGDVASVQLRLKDLSDDDIMRAGEVLKPIVQSAGAAFILNDRADLAVKLDADGVHIGQKDCSLSDARKIVGPSRIVGVTCHDSRHFAMEAAENGADYIAFGAFFPTTTKDVTAQAELYLLEWWTEMMVIPSVAIGGITIENARTLVEAGADFLAVSAGIWSHPQGPEDAVRGFNRILTGS